MTDLFEAGWSSVQLLWISMLIVEEKFLKKVEKTNTTVIGRDPKNHGLKEVLMVEVSTDRRTLVRRCYVRNLDGLGLRPYCVALRPGCAIAIETFKTGNL